MLLLRIGKQISFHKNCAEEASAFRQGSVNLALSSRETLPLHTGSLASQEAQP